MVLSRLTKITGPGIATDTNWVGNNADFTGITTTATSFNIGVTTIHSNLIEAHNIKSTGIITATGAHFSGNVSIAGTLTYEDVTNIDSVGIITAPAVDIDDFLDVGSNIKLGNAGVITATSFVGSGAALTGIDATAIKDSGGNVKIQAQASGAIHSGVSTFQDIDVDGHTNLDNVSIAGVSTFSSDLNVAENIIHIGDTDTKIRFANDVIQLQGGGTNRIQTNNIGARIDTTLLLYGDAGNPGRLRLQEGGALSEIMVGRNSDSSSFLYFKTEISGTTASRVLIDESGHFRPNVDSTYDLGITGTRWRNVYADTLYGDGSNLTGITGTTINNNADNRVITGSGTANTLNGESTLTYDASLLNISSSTQGLGLRLQNTGNEYTEVRFDAARTSAGGALGILQGRWNNSQNVCAIYLQAGDDTTNKDDGRISMFVQSASGSSKTALKIEPDASVQLPNDSQKLQLGNDQDLNIWHGGSNGYIDNETGSLVFRTTSSNTERLRIDSSGRIGLGIANPDAYFSSYNRVVMGRTNDTGGMTIVSAPTSGGYIAFADGTSGNEAYRGTIAYYHNIDALAFSTAATERLRLDSGGRLGINVASTAQLAASKKLTIRPGNDDGIRLVRPGDTNNSPNIHLDLTTTTSGSAFPSGEAYTTKYMTWNSDQIFETYAGGGTGGNISFRTSTSNNSSESLRITKDGHLLPGADNSYDLGSSSKRWRNLYTTDLQLSNKGKTNDVDGTWGDWTLQEGENKIFMINNRTGKKYSLKMEKE